MAITASTAQQVLDRSSRQEFGFIADTFAELSAANRTPYSGSLVYVVDTQKYYAILEDSLDIFDLNLRGVLDTPLSLTGNTGEVQYNNGGGLASAANVEIHSDDLVLAATASPAVPASNTVKLFNKQVAGRNLLATLGASGLDTILSPYPGRNRIAQWTAVGNSNAISVVDIGALTTTGTATVVNVATTNLYTRMRRLDFRVTVAAANAIAGWRYSQPVWGLGNLPNTGGFHYTQRFGNSTGAANATNRCFVGLTNSTAAPTDVQPSTLLNMIGVGWDSADANLQIMHNDGAGVATKVNLGASFPVPVADLTKVWELSLFCAPNSSQVGYQLTDLSTGVSASGTLTTDLPSNTTLLAPRGWMSSGGTSSVVGISFNSLTIETDF